jgi:hypothetical protein
MFTKAELEKYKKHYADGTDPVVPENDAPQSSLLGAQTGVSDLSDINNLPSSNTSVPLASQDQLLRDMKDLTPEQTAILNNSNNSPGDLLALLKSLPQNPNAQQEQGPLPHIDIPSSPDNSDKNDNEDDNDDEDESDETPVPPSSESAKVTVPAQAIAPSASSSAPDMTLDTSSLEKAQAEQKARNLDAGILAAAAHLQSGLLHQPLDLSASQMVQQQGAQGIQNIKDIQAAKQQQLQMKAEGLNVQKAVMEINDQKAMDDKNSTISQGFRDLAKKMNVPVNDNATASQIKAQVPMIDTLFKYQTLQAEKAMQMDYMKQRNTEQQSVKEQKTESDLNKQIESNISKRGLDKQLDAVSKAKQMLSTNDPESSKFVDPLITQALVTGGRLNPAFIQSISKDRSLSGMIQQNLTALSSGNASGLDQASKMKLLNMIEQQNQQAVQNEYNKGNTQFKAIYGHDSRISNPNQAPIAPQMVQVMRIKTGETKSVPASQAAAFQGNPNYKVIQ